MSKPWAVRHWAVQHARPLTHHGSLNQQNTLTIQLNNSTELNQENLSQLADEIGRPDYERRQMKAGIIHVGVGGFHRSHEAFYTDELMKVGDCSEWGICGVGLREDDRTMAEALRKQDFLYTLIVRHPD